MRLSEYSDEGLRAEFERSIDNLGRLEEISAALKPRSSDEAIELHMNVVLRLRTLKKAVSPPTPPVALSVWLSTYLFRRSLKSPDGRPLHQYRMSDTEYEEIRRQLRMNRTKLLDIDGTAARVFVLFCAEWFRRDATSMLQKWENLTSDVFADLPYKAKQELAEAGLRYWKRELIKSENGRAFLLSLALEGGISAHVVADGGSSWLSDYLRLIMRFALTDAPVQHVAGFAHDLSWRIPKSYRQDGFIALCCELVMKLADWRREVDSGPAGIDPVAYLDARNPQWKETLPIYMPPNDDRIARKLLGGLLKEKAENYAVSGVAVERRLNFDGTRWLPALSLSADGEISASKLQNVPTVGRWKASPSSHLANFLPSQIALFEAPVEGQHSWRVRPMVRLDKPIVGFPLNQAVSVNLTCGSDAVSLTWPGGGPIMSPIATFVPDQHAADGALPKSIKLVKTGSASLLAPLVFVLVPEDWVATAADGSTLGDRWPVEGRKILHAVSGTTYFSKPGASTSDRYRVEAGKDERQEGLDLQSGAPSPIEPRDELEVFEGAIRIKISSGPNVRDARVGEVLFRRAGEQWQRLKDGRLSESGIFDISWRDPVADIQIDRRRVAILPVGARLLGELVDGTEGVVTYESLQGWRVSLSEGTEETVRRENRVGFSFLGKPRYRQDVILRSPHGQSFTAIVAMKGRNASIILSDGRLVGPGQEMDVTALRGAIAVSPHPTALTLVPKASKTSSLQFKVSGEFPLSALKKVVEEFMAPMDDQDAVLEMDFLGETRMPIRLRQYRYERPTWDGKNVRFRGEFAATPVARMIFKPEREHLLRSEEGGLHGIPDWCEGPCLIYLRDGPDVVSRPLIVDLPIASGIQSPLHAALALPEFHARTHSIRAMLDLLETGTLPADDVLYLTNLVNTLNGLPATAFDILKEMARRPRALLRLLLSAKDSERQAIWNLQEQLPFLWLAIPHTDWQTAFASERDAVERALALVPETMRQELLIGHFRGLQESVLLIEPGLDRFFVRSGFPSSPLPSLDQVLQGFIQDQRLFDDDAPPEKLRRNPILEQLASAGIKLPDVYHRFSVTDFDGIAAPAALAAAAHGLITLTPSTEIVLRKTLREHGRYVSFAYPHLARHFEVIR